MDRTEEAQKKYYDGIAGIYDEYYFSESARNYRAAIYDKFCSSIALDNIKVLDAMCGGGEASAYFMSRGAEVTAVDISESCCDIYSKRLGINGLTCFSCNFNYLFSKQLILIEFSFKN
jgi:2-polyprenyl-3-methyl-5-hydroxy-6-metoxy-1,4-benzoquinol methylase